MNPFLRYLADKNSAHSHTPMITRPVLAAYGAQVKSITVIKQMAVKLHLAQHNQMFYI